MQYGISIAGPDDIIGPKSEIEALRYANEVNKIWVDEYFKDGSNETPLHVATVKPWSEILG